MAEDRLEGWEVAGGLYEPTGEGDAQVVSPERDSGRLKNVPERVSGLFHPLWKKLS